MKIKNKEIKTEKVNKMRNEAITLIALVITIIILLILAGVTINIIIGKGSLIEKAGKATDSYSEQSAREKLEIALGKLQTDKYIDKNYNKNEYIDNELAKQEMVVVDNIVIVDDWKFEIDRDVPKIVTSLGKGEQNKEIVIQANVNIREDYVKANLETLIKYEGTIEQIIIKGEVIQVPEKVEGTYALTKEITENGTYTIYAKDEDGNYKIAQIKVTDITEDMDIWNRQDMEIFRNKVNEGRTFEGRTARVMADIDLEGTQENQWVPIGNYIENEKLVFKGTFEGNNHVIDNVYINSTNNYQGIFGCVDNAKITGIVTGKNNSITGNAYVGGIVAYAKNNSVISNCGNNGIVNNNIKMVAGGIVGFCINTQIIGTYNKGNITGGTWVGGIVGQNDIENDSGSTVKYSYNLGNITGAYYVGGIIGRFRRLYGML